MLTTLIEPIFASAMGIALQAVLMASQSPPPNTAASCEARHSAAAADCCLRLDFTPPTRSAWMATLQAPDRRPVPTQVERAPGDADNR